MGIYDKLVNDGNVLQGMDYAFCRWQDEKGYEDFSEYVEFIKRRVEDVIGKITNVKGTKRPFGIKFTHNGFNLHLTLQSKGEKCWLRLTKIKNN